MRNGLGLWIVMAIAMTAGLRWAEGAERVAKPNIVFILADDLGWADIGCFGSTFYQTPSVDRLAREGMRFTNAYAACPVCSPTRASILTGKYPARLKLTDWLVGKRKGKLNPAKFVDHLPEGEVTLAAALKEAGYATGLIGKWHLGEKPYWPERFGFDVNIGGGKEGHPPSHFSPYGIQNLKDGPKGEYLADRLTDEAIRYIEANRDRPFLLYLSHYAVHNPKQAKAEIVQKYKDRLAAMGSAKGPRFRQEGQSRDRRVQDDPVYAGMVQSMDESVGRVMDKLAELGLAERTIVVFFSDNGGLSTAEGSPTSNAPLRTGKGWLYEGGIREPLVVKWPGAVKAGSVCDEAVTSTHFYPTLLEAVGVAQRPGQHCDGVSIVPLLRQTGRVAREAIYWHYPHYSNQGGKPGGAVRVGDWKLIESYEDGRVELYNLREDLGERRDLAGERGEMVKELRGRLERWRRSVGAEMPTVNADYRGR